MKTSLPVRFGLVASLAFAPALAFSADVASVQGCMDSFAAQHFPDSKVSFVVQGDTSLLMPLAANGGTRQVQLVASDRSSGRVLATATCAVRDSAKTGRVIVLSPL